MSFLEAINTCVGIARNEYTLEEIETMKKECTMVVMEWPILPKKFNRKENTMKYMTNQMLQRFMSNMSTMLSATHANRAAIEGEIKFCKESELFKDGLPAWYSAREEDRKLWLKMEYIQWTVKSYHRNSIPLLKTILQRMEKVVTEWINDAHFWIEHNKEQFKDSRGGENGKYWYNQMQSSKKKLAKLVELQQAIRKQKRVTRN